MTGHLDSDVCALVKDGYVTGVVDATPEFLDETAGTGLYDVAVDIEDLDPPPGIGWVYDADTDTFTPPTG